MSIFNSIISISGDEETAGCSHSKRNLDNDNVLSRKKKYFNKKIKHSEHSDEFEEQNLDKSEYANEKQ